MGVLIVEEHVGTKGLENLVLGEAAEEEGFIHTDIPFPEGVDHAGVGRTVAGGHYGDADRALIGWELALDLCQCQQQLGERSLA